MSQSPHIFVVDDEAPAREMVGDYLQAARLRGDPVRRRREPAPARSPRTTPDLIVLDLNMPEEDGLSIVRYVKQEADVPIIMLTATASTIDRVVGLELGADDYLAKPCELRELLARIRSVLRRSPSAPARRPPQAAAAASRAGTIRFGTKWLDLDAHVLRDDDGMSTRSPAPSSPCSKPSPKTRGGCCRASGCSTSPTPATATPSTAPSTCASRASGARSSPIRRAPHHPHGSRRRLSVFAGRVGRVIRANCFFSVTDETEFSGAGARFCLSARGDGQLRRPTWPNIPHGCLTSADGRPVRQAAGISRSRTAARASAHPCSCACLPSTSPAAERRRTRSGAHTRPGSLGARRHARHGFPRGGSRRPASGTGSADGRFEDRRGLAGPSPTADAASERPASSRARDGGRASRPSISCCAGLGAPPRRNAMDALQPASSSLRASQSERPSSFINPLIGFVLDHRADLDGDDAARPALRAFACLGDGLGAGWTGLWRGPTKKATLKPSFTRSDRGCALCASRSSPSAWRSTPDPVLAQGNPQADNGSRKPTAGAAMQSAAPGDSPFGIAPPFRRCTRAIRSSRTSPKPWRRASRSATRPCPSSASTGSDRQSDRLSENAGALKGAAVPRNDPCAGRGTGYVFIDSKNSPLVLVLRSLSSRKSIASIVPIGLRMRRSTYIFLS